MNNNPNDPIDIEDDVDLSDDSWSDLDEDVQEIKPAARPPKNKPANAKKTSGKNLNAIIIGVVAVAGGAYFFSPYLMPGSGTQQGVATPQEIIPEAPQDDQLASAAPSLPQGSGDTPPEIPLVDAAQGESGGLVPLPVPASDGTTNSEATLPSLETPADTQAVISPLAEPAIPADVAPQAQDAPGLIASAPPVEPAPVAPVEVMSAAPASDATTDAKIDALENDLVNMREAVSARADQTDARINELAQNLADISKKLDALAAIPRSTSDSVVSPLNDAPAEEILKPVTPARERSKPKTQAKPKSVAKVKAEKNVEPKPNKATAIQAPQQRNLPVLSSWQLRSARPGAAVISQPGSGEMRDIAVGARVDGIGTVRSIALENGTWVVRGTRGEIRR